MNKETVTSLFIRINEYLDRNKEKELELQWHGGEPLMAGPPFYQLACQLQDKYCSHSKNRIAHSMQTNLTCLTDRYWHILEKLGIVKIGTSFDPEPHIRGFGDEIDSNKYMRKFFKAINLLDRYRINWGLNYVVTKKSLQNPLAIFSYLTNLNLSGQITLSPVFLKNGEQKNLVISTDEYITFLEKIFPVWWRLKSRFINTEPFVSTTEYLLNRNKTLSDLNVFDVNDLHLNVHTDGKVTKFNNFLSTDRECLGNIYEHTLETIFIQYENMILEETNDQRNDGFCKDCSNWNMCFAGYKIDGFSQNMILSKDRSWCQARQSFVTKISEQYFRKYYA